MGQIRQDVARSSSVIGEIVPPAVAAVEAFDDLPDAALFPGEEAVVARSVEKRRQEFATVRVCARTALAKLGLPPTPILPGPRGAPAWPSGVVGSMTHCAGYRAAALAHRRDVLAIGIDAEVNEVLPGGVLDLVSAGAERSRLSRLSAERPGVSWDRLLFSAKESVYKAWYPLTRTWLGFGDAEVTIDVTGQFVASLLVPGPVCGFAGRWLARDGLLVTAIIVPAGDGGAPPGPPMSHAIRA